MNDILAGACESAGLFNVICTLAAIALSFVALIQTFHNSRKEQKRFEKELEESRTQFSIQLKNYDEVQKIHEQPWLVLDRTNLSQAPDGTYLLNFIFKNKGRGAAYSLQPPTECKPISATPDKQMMRRGGVQDPVVLVGELFKISFALGDNSKFSCFETNITIVYKDASGRQYQQTFDIIIDNDAYAHLMNYAEPELQTDSCKA